MVIKLIKPVKIIVFPIEIIALTQHTRTINDCHLYVAVSTLPVKWTHCDSVTSNDDIDLGQRRLR